MQLAGEQRARWAQYLALQYSEYGSYPKWESLCMCVFQTGVPKQRALHQQTHQGLLLSIQHHLPLSPKLSFLRRQKRDRFGQIAPRVLFFSHISSYNGRFMMQLQLLCIGPICGLPVPVFQPSYTQTPVSL